LRDWLDHPGEREKIAANSHRLARPDASHVIAHAVADQLGVTEEIIQRISENEK
jgi:hypothetical protein